MTNFFTVKGSSYIGNYSLSITRFEFEFGAPFNPRDDESLVAFKSWCDNNLKPFVFSPTLDPQLN